MSRVTRSVRSWVHEAGNRTSLWEAFINFLLALFVLVRKVREFLSTELPEEELDDFYDSFASLTLSDSDDDLSDSVQHPPAARPLPFSSSQYTLTSVLPDTVIKGPVWAALNSPPSISLLRRLNRVNNAWRSFTSGTVEWAALEFVRLDTPGYARFVERERLIHGHNLRYKTRGDRFGLELNHFRTILDEPQVPIYSLIWCTTSIPAGVTDTDPDLDYYARVAQEYT